jgi:hypothetical protein
MVCNGEYVEVDGTNITQTGTIGYWSYLYYPGLGFTPNIPYITITPAPGTSPTPAPTTPQNPDPPEPPGSPNTPNTPNSPQAPQTLVEKAKEAFKRAVEPLVALGREVGCTARNGYGDANFTAAAGPYGITFGVNISNGGLNVYGGYAAGAGVSTSLTYSANQPSPGLNAALAGTLPPGGVSFTGQAGLGPIGPGIAPFTELGTSFGTPGGNFSLYLVSPTIPGSQTLFNGSACQ